MPFRSSLNINLRRVSTKYLQTIKFICRKCSQPFDTTSQSKTSDLDFDIKKEQSTLPEVDNGRRKET